MLQARFIRTALEIESMRVACERLTEADFRVLEENMTLQEAALNDTNKMVFHHLDDAFHREICERSGVGFIWKLIQENKAHMDRVRFLSLSFASTNAHGDHLKIFEALRHRDADGVTVLIRTHLSAIVEHFRRIRAEHLIYFADEG